MASESNASDAAAGSAAAGSAVRFHTVSPAIRYVNHALSGVTEASQVAVRISEDATQIEYEPARPWIRHATTAALFGATAAAIWYRRLRLARVGGLVSLAGASRPVLSGLAWTTGIAGALNARPTWRAPPAN
ncbi:hypothetical protein IWQ56_000427 [Coemansia nantahalensis]|uniref:Uncharacterized protein n=1 Tax=Coemansia nantahalensis TaxID=2789366 RepID=A0ACC1K6A0_9FUNG|nr:hypothetical protein IWQ57_001096 [Coemansia nantahalensis]KAJ2774783.1 hypothetical protein IWQ56_000427 [Coemansia nantahalensis]